LAHTVTRAACEKLWQAQERAEALAREPPPCAVCGQPVEIDGPRHAGWYAHIECAGHLDLSPIKAASIKEATQQMRERGAVVLFECLGRDAAGAVTLHVRPGPEALKTKPVDKGEPPHAAKPEQSPEPAPAQPDLFARLGVDVEA
jgi:hypothetical protein